MYSTKDKIVYVVGKPCHIYRLRGNPIVVIIGLITTYIHSSKVFEKYALFYFSNFITNVKIATVAITCKIVVCQSKDTY